MSATNSEYRLGASRAYAGFTIIAHLGAVCCLAAAHVPALVPLFAGVLLALSLCHDLRRTAWRTAPTAVIAIRMERERWSLLQRNGCSVDRARLLAARIVCGALVITLGREVGSRIHVIVPADALPADALRRLRARTLMASGDDAR